MTKHPLDDAVARVNRAQEHISELESIVATYAQRIGDDHRIVDYDPVAKKKVFKFTEPERNLLLPIVVGEIVYNLRAALDYIVYALAREDSGVVQEGTQFLIEDVKSDPNNRSGGFDAKIKRFLKGVSQAHIDAIEMLQPYKGTEWTKTLRDISNPDKHRELAKSQAHVWTVIFEETGNNPPMLVGAKKYSAASPDDTDVHMHTQNIVEIRFRDGLPVIETLKILQSQVAATIELFKPEFKVSH